MNRETAINLFLQRFAADWAQAVQRSLEEYQQQFPGHEATVAEQYELLAGGGTDRSCASADGQALGEGAEIERLGPYRLLHELGRGGQGEVWLAEDERLGRRVALKTLTAVGRLDERGVARLQREARVASRLEHQGVCTIYEADQVEGVPFLAMQYVQGRSLAELIKSARSSGGERGPLPLPVGSRAEVLTVAAFFEQAARALEHAHQREVLHRDIKPGNVVATPSGHPVLLDFGLARDLEGEEGTISEGISGTPAYIAPERLAIGGPPDDLRVDIYGLGIALYETLALRRPFEAATREQLFRAILETEAEDVRRLVPSVPRDLATVIATAMAKEPERRYASAAALADDLRAVCEGHPILARVPTRVERAWLWARRRPRLAGMALTLAAALVVTGMAVGFLALRWPAIQRGQSEAAEELRRQHLDAGYLEIGEGDPATSLAHFQAVVREHPEDALALTGAALAHLTVGDSESALAVLAQAPPTSAIERVRAEVWRWAGHEERARAIEAQLTAPASGFEHFVAGSLELFRGHRGRVASFEPAVDHFIASVASPERPILYGYISLADALGHAPRAGWVERVLDVLRTTWPEHPAAHLTAGGLVLQLDPAAAQDHFERVLELDPASARAVRNLAKLAGDRGDHESARRFLERALELHPEHSLGARSYANLALLHMHLGEEQQALESIARAREADPREQSSLSRALSITRQARGVDAAGELARDELERNPAAVRALEFLGRYSLNRGRMEEAEGYAERACRLHPWDGPSWALLGTIYSASARFEDALRARQRAAECSVAPADRFGLLIARLEVGDLEGLADAAHDLAAEGFVAAEPLALVSEATARFRSAGVPDFTQAEPAADAELEAAARALELADDPRAATAWRAFMKVRTPPASPAGTAYWRSVRIDLRRMETDAQVEAMRRCVAFEIETYAKAWAAGRATPRVVAEALHRIAHEPALDGWRDAPEGTPWHAVFARVAALREELIGFGD